MIGDLNETLKQLLIDRIPLDPREVEIAFDPPDSEWSGAVSTPTINCYLFHIQENHQLRQNEWERQKSVDRGDIVRKRLAFRMEMHYQLTVWATSIEDEHRLLWRILAALMPFQTLPRESLKGDLRETDWPIPMLVAQPNGLLKNPSDFWSSFEKFIKPGVSCVFTLPLDSGLSFSAPPVLSRRLDMREMDRTRTGNNLSSMGGFVLANPDDRLGVPLATVRILERGVETTTDIYGRFVFDGLQPGNYTLEARTDDRRGRRQVSLPGANFDVVLEGAGQALAATAPKERR